MMDRFDEKKFLGTVAIDYGITKIFLDKFRFQFFYELLYDNLLCK